MFPDLLTMLAFGALLKKKRQEPMVSGKRGKKIRHRTGRSDTFRELLTM